MPFSNRGREPLLTVGLFVAIELVANSVEAWPYGATTEISPLAVIVSALFWTWLWGGVGPVLATPLTVCLDENQGCALSSRTARSEASNPGFLHEISLNLGIPAASLLQENHQ